ncbi:rab GTPase-activating protein 22-like [Wolffia australiana]
MSFDGDERRWMCGRGAGVNLHRVSSIVRDIREPCLHHSPGKRHKMLKPERWHSIFDNDGRVIAFRKALKSIILGGIDPSIRAEVWEFLLGCYALNSTSEHRKQLRIARRERYEDLIRECQMMHGSVGTGMLAYAVGSKLMDVRTPSKHTITGEIDDRKKDVVEVQKKKSSGDSANFISLMESKDSVMFDASSAAEESRENDGCPAKPEEVAFDDRYGSENFFDFPPLPVTNLFRNNYREKQGFKAPDALEDNCRLEGGIVHSFQISENADIVIESENTLLHPKSSGTGGLDKKNQISGLNGSASCEQPVGDKRISEWLWTLHRIVVDVVRTDGHLEFYEDSKNMARMSDILAVYAWIDPATGYCQGMSDLLSPFIVLYEDNADAFWCFEMLLRRMRENFLIEGPVGVMKQLQELWKILELTDAEIFAHLSLIGAESLHFAFRMLLVLFRRELSFNEALSMWEMMWAADFDEAVSCPTNENGLQSLSLQLPVSADFSRSGDLVPSDPPGDGHPPRQDNVDRPISRNPFCGLARASFWASRQAHDQLSSSTPGGNLRCDQLPVFCVAAVLILNRFKIMRETQSSDDMIKMFNDKLLKINVKKCIHLAIKLRKRYFYKLTKLAIMGAAGQREGAPS